MIREEFTEAKAANVPVSEKFTVLVLGGSQGAQSINRAVLAALDTLAPVKYFLDISNVIATLSAILPSHRLVVPGTVFCS